MHAIHFIKQERDLYRRWFLTIENKMKRAPRLKKALYWKRKEQGLCTRCGKPNTSAYTFCIPCSTIRKIQQKGRKEKWKEQGLCTKCGKEKEDINYNMCRKCRLIRNNKCRKSKGLEMYASWEDFINKARYDYKKLELNTTKNVGGDKN